MDKKPAKDDAKQYVFVKSYINRWGKLMVAAEYGYEAWRIPIKRGK